MASKRVFSLSNKALKLSTADDLDTHIGPLIDSTDFTEIQLNGNTIGVPAAQRLSELLRKQKSLESVDFADIFTARLLSEIPPALSAILDSLLECPTLRTVNLSDNAFGLNTVQPLVDFIGSHVPLQHLILNNNGLGPEAGSRVADALAQLARKKDAARGQAKDNGGVPELETIICGRNRLEAGSMPAWAAAFGLLGRIKTVRMVQNGIRQEGIIKLLRDGLVHCSELETLDLQDNTFTASGAKALADAVGAWPKLIELGVGESLLSARGGVLLGEALAQGKNTSLRLLKLQYNEIDAKGLAAMVRVVAADGLPQLRRIELNGNKFSEDDVNVVKLREILEERRDKAGNDGADEDEDGWGVDDLSDMEEESEPEDEEEGEGEEEEAAKEREKKAEAILKDADEEEGERVAQEQDKAVDELADALGKQL